MGNQEGVVKKTRYQVNVDKQISKAVAYANKLATDHFGQIDEDVWNVHYFQKMNDLCAQFGRIKVPVVQGL